MLSIIAAVAKNNVIGIKNELPWRLSGDLKYFSKITTGNSVLMGEKTFLSIFSRLGKPLPNRKNYVLSREDKKYDGVEIVNDLKSFIEAKKNEDIYIIGGASVYEQTIGLVDRMYITDVDCVCAGDVFFPKFNLENWNLISQEKHLKDEKNEYDYTFKVYERK